LDFRSHEFAAQLALNLLLRIRAHKSIFQVSGRNVMGRIFSQLATGLALVVGTALLASTMWAQDAATQSQPQPGDQMQAQQAATTRTFAGKIVKQGDKYVLRDVANKVTYMLDAQDDLKAYEGKEVTVIGSLDSASRTIHVQKVQAPS